METVSPQTLISAILPYIYALIALAGVFALVQLGRLFGTARKQVDEAGNRVQPIIEKADTSVDALNAEILRVDGILSDVERITNAAANTTQSVEKVANAPLEIAQSLSERLLDLFKSSSRDKDGFSKEKGDPAKSPAADADYVTSMASSTALEEILPEVVVVTDAEPLSSDISTPTSSDTPTQ